MLGYRIKQTAFILAGLVVFFMTWERFTRIFSHYGNVSDSHKGEHLFTQLIWLAICLGCGEIVARVTGGMDDADVKPVRTITNAPPTQ